MPAVDNDVPGRDPRSVFKLLATRNDSKIEVISRGECEGSMNGVIDPIPAIPEGAAAQMRQIDNVGSAALVV